MEYRLLDNGDTVAIKGLLLKFASTSLFMLSNIEQTQIRYTGAMYEGRYYGAFSDQGLVAVLVQYWNGNLMFQGDAMAVEELWRRFGTHFIEINGFIGREDLCQLLKSKYDQRINAKPFQVNSTELLYELDLSSLKVPEALTSSQAKWHPAKMDELEYLIPWMVDYNIEALGAVKNEALVEAVSQSMVAKIQAQDTFVITVNEVPVATAAYNAKTHPYVQIGAVWTPVDLRGNGYAQCAVAAALMNARDTGFKQSVLFTDTNNLAAQKAYEKIGYRMCGEFGLYIIEG